MLGKLLPVLRSIKYERAQFQVPVPVELPEIKPSDHFFGKGNSGLEKPTVNNATRTAQQGRFANAWIMVRKHEPVT